MFRLNRVVFQWKLLSGCANRFSALIIITNLVDGEWHHFLGNRAMVDGALLNYAALLPHRDR
jgi:hypothetical protein